MRGGASFAEVCGVFCKGTKSGRVVEAVGGGGTSNEAGDTTADAAARTELDGTAAGAEARSRVATQS